MTVRVDNWTPISIDAQCNYLEMLPLSKDLHNVPKNVTFGVVNAANIVPLNLCGSNTALHLFPRLRTQKRSSEKLRDHHLVTDGPFMLRSSRGLWSPCSQLLPQYVEVVPGGSGTHVFERQYHLCRNTVRGRIFGSCQNNGFAGHASRLHAREFWLE